MKHVSVVFIQHARLMDKSYSPLYRPYEESFKESNILQIEMALSFIFRN